VVGISPRSPTPYSPLRVFLTNDKKHDANKWLWTGRLDRSPPCKRKAWMTVTLSIYICRMAQGACARCLAKGTLSPSPCPKARSASADVPYKEGAKAHAAGARQAVVVLPPLRAPARRVGRPSPRRSAHADCRGLSAAANLRKAAPRGLSLAASLRKALSTPCTVKGRHGSKSKAGTAASQRQARQQVKGRHGRKSKAGTGGTARTAHPLTLTLKPEPKPDQMRTSLVRHTALCLHIYIAPQPRQGVLRGGSEYLLHE
jgi:hypothetical protein